MKRLRRIKAFNRRGLMILTALFAALLTLTIHAEDETLIKLSVEAKRPANQMNSAYTYFYLGVNPGDVQTIEVEVVNIGYEDIEVEATINLALSNHVGVIVYGNQTDGVKDESMVHDIRHIATIKDPIIKVPVGETVSVPIDLVIPETPFPGILLGGIDFSLVNNQSTGMIRNEYGYNIGLVLTEDKNELLPVSKHLDLIKVHTELVDLRKITILEFQNSEPAILKNLNIQTKVINKETQEIVLNSDTQDYSISPNTIMQYHLDWKYKNVKPGSYRAIVDAQSLDESWHWEIDFTIDGDNANEINKASIYHVSIPEWIKKFTMILIVITIVNIGYLSIRKLRGKKV